MASPLKSSRRRAGDRSFTAAEKLRIVRQAAACTQRGEVEALLRREGIYSSLLSAWRKQIDLHGTEALAGRKPGRKPKQDAKDLRIAELEKRAAKLEAKLSLTGKLLELQKNPHDESTSSVACACLDGTPGAGKNHSFPERCEGAGRERDGRESDSHADGG